VAQLPAVLVVDDTLGTREGLAQLLRLQGYEACEAADGAEALALLRQRPDIRLVVLDIRMPGADGWWFRRHQLEDPAIAGIPVVAFSGAADDPDTVRQKMGIEHVLRKPASVDALLQIIRRLCS
jgi:CheY-like chemotaxis protein